MRYADEPIFLPEPGATAEDAGVRAGEVFELEQTCFAVLTVHMMGNFRT